MIGNENWFYALSRILSNLSIILEVYQLMAIKLDKLRLKLCLAQVEVGVEVVVGVEVGVEVEVGVGGVWVLGLAYF